MTDFYYIEIFIEFLITGRYIFDRQIHLKDDIMEICTFDYVI